METVSSQPGQATAASSSNSSKNFKIWFDEIKAKVSKKNQASQVTTSDSTIVLADDASKDDTQASAQTLPIAQGPQTQASKADSITTVQDKSKSFSLRSRRLHKASSPPEADQDLGHISHNSFWQDCHNDSIITKKRRSSIISKLFVPFKCVIDYLIPFNATLPWKLISLINSCFVIIVIGIASGSSQTSTAFNFCNGFISGILVASICFIILSISFLLYIMPKSHHSQDSLPLGSPRAATIIKSVGQEDKLDAKKCNDSYDVQESGLNSKPLNGTTADLNKNSPGDFSVFEVLDHDSVSAEFAMNHSSIASQLGDENFKGWMIEFLGDYEQRNTSEFKLKSIFVRIEYGVLYLCKPKNNDIDAVTSLPIITNQRVYDLNSVQKFNASLLIPKNVRNKQKYVWSKKYPIKLEFQDSSFNTCDTNVMKNINQEQQATKTIELTLFAKSCREKEEWFRRFKRIIEDNRIAQGPCLSTRNLISPKTDETVSTSSLSESLFDSFRRLRRRSPSPKRNLVQTSRSSHLISEPSKVVEDSKSKLRLSSETESSSPTSAKGLVRTKSCELLDPSRVGSPSLDDADAQCRQIADEDETCVARSTAADDSTLTKETAELFSQAIEYSNFIESQPTLDFKDYIERVAEAGREATSTCDWFNALTGRIFFDVFSHNYWSFWFKRKIQRKLYRIRLPYFMETLTLTTIDLGTNAPQFLNVVSHRIDSYGLTIDFDMSYSGGLTMTFETKLNLLKIKTDNSSTRAEMNASANQGLASSPDLQADCSTTSQEKPHLSLDNCKDTNLSRRDSSSNENLHRDLGSGAKPLTSSSSTSVRTSGDLSTSDSDKSDSDSSSDSSFDEADANEISDWEDYGAEKTRQNIVKFVDKIASSRYFQHATENRYIKKKLQDISNCPLVLVVQIQTLNGILTLNVPPPQTDRIWYGFKPTPELILKALPKMGEREVNLTHVTDWIERKLAEEFRKILVIPNMEDIVLPVLKSDHMQYVSTTR